MFISLLFRMFVAFIYKYLLRFVALSHQKLFRNNYVQTYLSCEYNGSLPGNSVLVRYSKFRDHHQLDHWKKKKVLPR